MKGKRDKYKKEPSESPFDLYKRCTDLETYNHLEAPYTHLDNFTDKRGYEIFEIGDRKAEEFCEYLEEQVCGPKPKDLTKKTADTYLENLSVMFKWIAENTNLIDWEPFGSVADSYFEYDDRKESKRDVPIDNLRQAIQNIVDPNLLLFIVIALKTGMRKGEIVNLRLRDIHLDHPINEIMPAPRNKVADKPDSLYVDSNYDGNKKQSYREIPIDPELKETMVWYIKLRPPSIEEPAHLLVDLRDLKSTYTVDRRGTSEKEFTRWVKEHGWFVETRHPKNISPHWCRHWWTTTLQSNIDDEDVPVGDSRSYVKGVRGDSDTDTIDTYTHQWESLRGPDQPSYREVYINALPDLLVEPDDPEIESNKKRKELQKIVENRTSTGEDYK